MRRPLTWRDVLVCIGDGWRRYCDDEVVGVPPCDTALDSYRSLWQQINGPDSWESNPWVWVVEFKRIQVAPEGF